LDPNLESNLLSPLWIPSGSGVAITPHPLIGFASEYMCWEALLRDIPLNGVLSTTTRDRLGAGAIRHRNGECTWVECDLGADGPHSVMSLAASDVLIYEGWFWGLTEEVRKVRLPLLSCPPCKHYGSIQCNIHYVISNLIIVPGMMQAHQSAAWLRFVE
jgi:hypothetical protein